MSRAECERDNGEVTWLLAGAARAIASVRYCWLMTAGETGGISARPMGRVLPNPDENDWKVRFITDGRSRKASDIRRHSDVGLIFQHEPDEAYVALTGRAMLIENTSEVDRLWKNAYNIYFPSETDRAHAAFLEVNVVRMELWIRGVTQEPFGFSPARVEREVGGTWRVSDHNVSG
jgi:general stress protein 26